MESPKLLEPMATIVILLIITSIFFVGKSWKQINDGWDNPNTFPLFFLLLYFVIVVLVQIGVAVSNSTNKCGYSDSNGNRIPSPQPGSVILYALGPNLLIFGSIIVILLLMPGWKSVFSNTLGYLFVCLPFLNVNNALVDLLGKEEGNEMLEKICSNKNLVINEITPVNFNVIVPKLAGEKNFQENEAAKKALWKCIVIKDIIGDFIWYGLTLAFTVLVTYDSIIDIRCVNGKDFLTKKIQDQKDKAKETNPNIT